MADVSAAMSYFNAGWDHKPVREDRGLIANAVMIGVLQDQNLIVGRLAGLELRVDSTADHPNPAPGIKAHLDRLLHAVLFRSEELHLKTISHLKRSEFGSRVVRLFSRRLSSSGIPGQHEGGEHSCNSEEPGIRNFQNPFVHTHI